MIISQSPAHSSVVSRDWLICFSHLRWNFVYQRPQHLLTRAASTHRVSYIEEPVFEDIKTAFLRVEAQPSGVEVLTPVLPHGLSSDDVRDELAELVDQLVDHQPVAIAWYYTPMALEFSHQLSPDLVVYDCMDELSAFRGASPMIVEYEQRLLERADLVFTGGRSLYEAKKRLHPAVFAFPSSVDVGHFAKARHPAPDHKLQAEIAKPRVGFFGVVDERMDLDLVSSLAAMRPDLQFVVVGPIVKIDPASVPQHANLHWLGSQDYSVLPDLIRGWDAAFMPFAMNESTRFISPTKTPEFLASGKPVVSTPIADVVRPYGEKGLVEIASTASETSAALDRCLGLDRAPWLKKVDLYLAGISWDRTWREMSAAIANAANPPRSARTGSSRVSAEDYV